MRLLPYFRAFGAGFALVLLGVFAHAVVSPFWSNSGPGTTYGNPPSVNGPWLGDQVVNLYTVWRAITWDGGVSVTPAISVSQTSGQANCTQLSNDGFQQITTSASTGYACLPTAQAGKRTTIVMTPAQTLDIYSSAVSFVSGTADTINGTAGTTPYTTNTGSNKTTICIAPANGAWNCVTGS